MSFNDGQKRDDLAFSSGIQVQAFAETWEFRIQGSGFRIHESFRVRFRFRPIQAVAET